MKQRKAGNEIAARTWNRRKPWELYYVAQVPGDGGVDWGYVTHRANALPLNQYFMRRFVADCRRVGTLAFRSYVGVDELALEACDNKANAIA